MEKKMRRAVFERCTRLERCRALAHLTAKGLLEHQGAPLGMPGVFAFLQDQGMKPEVALASSHPANPITQPSQSLGHCLFELDTKIFGTAAEANPWITVTLKGCVLRPVAIGLKHGTTEGYDVCERWTIEARRGGGAWQQLLQRTNHRLTVAGEVFKLPASANRANEEDSFFDSFRVRLESVPSTARRCLMVSWFEVFGQIRTDLAAWLILVVTNSGVSGEANRGTSLPPTC